jgi:peptidyl-dipeptidase Dcp
MNRHRSGFLCFLSVSLFALAGAAIPQPAATPVPGANPLMTKSTLPFQAPPFDLIKVTDYQPAIEAGMKEQLAEVAAIANDPAPPTFDNTIVAMERSGELLTRAAKVFFNVEQADTNESLQKIKSQLAPKLSAHNDAINLNEKLYARVKAIYDKRDTLGLDPEAKYLVERYHLSFVRAGASLSPADKARLSKLNTELAELTTDFGSKLLADTNAAAVVVDGKAQLAGLSEGDLAAAAAAAKDKKLQGKWVLPLQNTTQQPPLTSLEERALRKKILEASQARGDHGGANDTRAVITRLVELRAEKAKILGFPDFATFVLADQMAKTPQNAENLMTGLIPAATEKARGEAAAIQKQIDAAGEGFRVTAADWNFYSEKVRKAEYDLDESEVRPYFELDRVLNDGVFFAATKMYGITFRERKDIPVYHPDVRVWEVFDADGSSLALFYGDFYQRPSKGGGAWCDTFVDQSRLFGWKPAVTNNSNFTKPGAGEPALLSSDNVRTLFHEFGHALHAIFQNVQYPTLGNTPRDFVEFPSQFNEHWAYEPTVFANFARHSKTGEPMPPALVEKIKRTQTFNQGYMTTEYLASALLDMAWHSLPAGQKPGDVNAFEKATLARLKLDLAEVPPRYRTTYFSHIWESSYAAGYYAYLWSEVLDADAYYWFKENGGMTRANGDRYRKMILARGGSEDVAAMYRAFRGRDPVVGPLLQERGLTAAGGSGVQPGVKAKP